MNKLVTLIASVAAIVLTACSSSSPAASPSAAAKTGLNDQAGATGKYLGFPQDPAQPRPSFTLTNTSGKPFAFGTATAGHPTLLFFGYTNCPDVCPATMADIRLALKSLPLELQKQTYVVFASTDVKRDTAAVLTKWLSNFTPDVHATFVGLRGTAAQVQAAEAASHVMLSEDDGQTHAAEVLLFGPDDYAHVAFNSSSNEEQAIAHDLKVVAG